MSNRSNWEEVDSDHVIRKLEGEEGYGFSRSVIPRNTGITREIPRLDHVGILFIEYSVMFIS